MKSNTFMEMLGEVCLPNVFNPYRDLCDAYDHAESPSIRCLNLRRYLETVEKEDLEAVWIGRDCGYRGGRRTGIALTDEPNLQNLEARLGNNQLLKATIGQPVRERTATEVWKIMQEVEAKVFLWNVFPFHPFESGNSMSNRCHSAREFKECREILYALLGWLKPRRIIALGGDAQKAVSKMGFEVFPVRHPSYGGHIQFASTIRDLYGCAPKPDLAPELSLFSS